MFDLAVACMMRPPLLVVGQQMRPFLCSDHPVRTSPTHHGIASPPNFGFSAERQRIPGRSFSEKEPQHAACNGKILRGYQRLDQKMELALHPPCRASFPATLVRERELNTPTIITGRNPLDETGPHQTIEQLTWTAGLTHKPPPDIAE